jgi:hypothetical protein
MQASQYVMGSGDSGIARPLHEGVRVSLRTAAPRTARIHAPRGRRTHPLLASARRLGRDHKLYPPIRCYRDRRLDALPRRRREMSFPVERGSADLLDLAFVTKRHPQGDRCSKSWPYGG